MVSLMRLRIYNYLYTKSLKKMGSLVGGKTRYQSSVSPPIGVVSKNGASDRKTPPNGSFEHIETAYQTCKPD